MKRASPNFSRLSQAPCGLHGKPTGTSYNVLAPGQPRHGNMPQDYELYLDSLVRHGLAVDAGGGASYIQDAASSNGDTAFSILGFPYCFTNGVQRAREGEQGVEEPSSVRNTMIQHVQSTCRPAHAARTASSADANQATCISCLQDAGQRTRAEGGREGERVLTEKLCSFFLFCHIALSTWQSRVCNTLYGLRESAGGCEGPLMYPMKVHKASI
jgi:hypothetical protein